MIDFAAAIASAFGRRFAGGLLGQWLGNIGGSQVGRLVQAAIAGATIAAVAPAAWWGLAAVPAVWAGATFGFPRCGMVPKGWRDVSAIAVRHGLLAVLPVAALLAGLLIWSGGAPWWCAAILLAGLARGPAYYVATLWQPYIPALGLNPDGISDPPALAEFYSGAAFGVALVVAL